MQPYVAELFKIEKVHDHDFGLNDEYFVKKLIHVHEVGWSYTYIVAPYFMDNKYEEAKRFTLQEAEKYIEEHMPK